MAGWFQGVKKFFGWGDGSEEVDGEEQNHPSSSSGPSPRGHRGRAAAGARERRHEPIVREVEAGQHGGVQGLRWYAARQLQDQHGDYANEFLDEDHIPAARRAAAAGAGPASAATAAAAAADGAAVAGGKERGSGVASRSEAASRAAAAAMARAAGKGGASSQGGHHRTGQAGKQLQVMAVDRGNVVLGH